MVDFDQIRDFQGDMAPPTKKGEAYNIFLESAFETLSPYTVYFFLFASFQMRSVVRVLQGMPLNQGCSRCGAVQFLEELAVRCAKVFDLVVRCDFFAPRISLLLIL